MSLLDKVKLAAMALLIALTLLLCAVQVEGLRLPVSQASQGQLVDARPASAQSADLHAIPGHGASQGDDGAVKFIGAHQNHLLRLEHSLNRDHQPGSVVYELVMSWSQQAILLLLCGLLRYAALGYPRSSFLDHFATIHRRRLQRRHLQYRFTQGLQPA